MAKQKVWLPVKKEKVGVFVPGKINVTRCPYLPEYRNIFDTP